MKHNLLKRTAIASLFALGLFTPLAHAEYTISEHERPIFQVQDESDVNDKDLVMVKHTFVLSPNSYFNGNSTVLNDTGKADLLAIARILNTSILESHKAVAAKFPDYTTLAVEAVVNTMKHKVTLTDTLRAEAIYKELLPNLHPDLANLLLTIESPESGKRVSKINVPFYKWDNDKHTPKLSGNLYESQFIHTNPEECNGSKCYTRKSLTDKVLLTIAYHGIAGNIITPSERQIDTESHYDIGVITGAVWCDKQLYTRKQCSESE